jgi:hypothetical protein
MSTLRLTPADLAVWAEHEAANARAARQYRDLPIAHWRAKEGTLCETCGATVQHPGLCRACRKAAS